MGYEETDEVIVQIGSHEVCAGCFDFSYACCQPIAWVRRAKGIKRKGAW